MSLSADAEAVLKSILSFGTGEDTFPFGGVTCQSPGGDALFQLCEILAGEPPESELQDFFAKNPGFLMGLFGMNDSGDLAFIAKPRIGTKFIADFAILQFFQGGSAVFLLEIETAHEKIFNASLAPARRLQWALTQIDDWRQWITPNRITFCRDLIDRAVRLPLYSPDLTPTTGCRFGDEAFIRNTWRSFGGETDPHIHYGIVVGRWANLSPAEKERFMSKFDHYGKDVTVFTFDQLARQAVYRPDRGY